MQKPDAFETLTVLTISIIATLIAAFVGTTIILIATAPFSLLAIIAFPIYFASLLIAAVLAAPVTFVLLPLTYLLLKRQRPILMLLVIPIVGLIGGGFAMYAWVELGLLPRQYHQATQQLFSVAGMLSGFSAGAFYGRSVYA